MKEEGEPRNPVKDFGWLALFLIVLGVIWFAQGGPSKLTSMTSPFLQTPSIDSSPVNSLSHPSQSGYNSWLDSSETVSQISDTESRYKGKISLNSAWPAKEIDPQKEYIEISASYSNSNKEPISITGWTLKGKQGLGVTIGKGAYLVYSAQLNTQDAIFLGPNDRAIIATGHSPIGTSFRLNLCTGYFSQFQDFIPALPQECPRIFEKEIPINYPDACIDFVKSLSACKMPLTAVPLAAGNDCANFVSEKANYNGCVSTHKSKDNFYKPEWRIYLGRDAELWGTRDNITLFDNEGKIVDQVLY